MSIFDYFQLLVPTTGYLEIDVMMYFITFIMTYVFILSFIGVIKQK